MEEVVAAQQQNEPREIAIERFPKPSLSPQQADGVLRSASRRKSLISNWAQQAAGYLTQFEIKKYLQEHILLVGVLLFAAIVRIYFFIKVGVQPIWWDEGDYLSLAKIWALDMPRPDWYEHFVGLRPLLYPLVLFSFLKIGLGELSIRFFTLLLPSIGVVYFTYRLGTSMYNKLVGAAAAVMISVYWVGLFYTYRILTDIPSLFFGLACIFFFWEYYIQRNKPWGLYVGMLFGVLAFSTRFPLALVPISLALFLIFIKKWRVITDKTIWKGLGLTIIFLSPYIVYFITSNFYALKFYLVSGATVDDPLEWSTIGFFAGLPFTFWKIAFILGVVSFYSLFLYGDMIWKQKTTKFNADIFIILFMLVHFYFYIAVIREHTDRWLLMMMPLMFIIAGKGLHWAYSLIKPYSKSIAIIAVGILLIGGVYQNLTHAHNLIMAKKDSYKEIKLAGEWLRENTPPETRVITSSVVQSQYYSERWNEGHSNKNHRMPPETKCIDNLGGTSQNASCQALSEELFELSKAEFKPDYFIVSVFEPVFTPQWVYSYGQRKNLAVVQAYAAPGNPQQAMLVIYKL